MQRFLLRLLLYTAFFPGSCFLTAQVPAGYWQQRVEYQIDVRLDDQTHAVQGRLKLKYFNNSPDTLRRVFFHLYWNAFQPNSAYARWANQTNDIATNPKLFDLLPAETGRQDIFSVQQNGGAVSYRVNETIMEVELSRPLNPGDFDVYDIAWQGQVPLAIKRGGRENSMGVAYSFTQWYPKICAYDRSGWHADPYIGREFFGEFGSFKVNITLPKKYVVAATGVLQNANTVGYGYEDEGVKAPPNYGFVNVWKFEAANVHDFAWSADPDYVHEKIRVRDGLTLHFFYQPSSEVTSAYKSLQKFAVENLPYIEANYGKYLYPQFTFAEGGEGAMEYPMMTLIEINDSDSTITQTAMHEWMHNWYYGMMGNNENAEHWLDEGFASYATTDILNHADPPGARTRRRTSFGRVEQNIMEVLEPTNTPANAFSNSFAYYFSAYSKSEVFLWQLRYIIGDEAFKRGILRYHTDWHFKHPTGDDFMRTMERASGMELDWFYAGWIKTLKTVDYSVSNILPEGSAASKIILRNHGSLPMPVEALVEFKNGSSERHYIPLDLQYGAKDFPADAKMILHEPWSFSVDTYEIRLDKPVTDIKAVTIDPAEWTADTDRKNNKRER